MKQNREDAIDSAFEEASESVDAIITRRAPGERGYEFTQHEATAILQQLITWCLTQIDAMEQSITEGAHQ